MDRESLEAMSYEEYQDTYLDENDHCAYGPKGWVLTIYNMCSKDEILAQRLNIPVENFRKVCLNCNAIYAHDKALMFLTAEDAEAAIVAFKLLV